MLNVRLKRGLRESEWEMDHTNALETSSTRLVPGIAIRLNVGNRRISKSASLSWKLRSKIHSRLCSPR
jgi:hypothetical protein